MNFWEVHIGAIAIIVCAALFGARSYVALLIKHRDLRARHERLRLSKISAVEIGEGAARRRIEYARGDHDEFPH